MILAEGHPPFADSTVLRNNDKLLFVFTLQSSLKKAETAGNGTFLFRAIIIYSLARIKDSLFTSQGYGMQIIGPKSLMKYFKSWILLNYDELS